MDIAREACVHQTLARHHANTAWAALDCGYIREARHHQSMARFHHERAWMFLLSLLLRDPII